MTLFDSRRTVAALVLANAALLGAVALSSSRPAQASFGGSSGEYVLAVGQSTGLPQETVYVVNTNSGKVVPVSFDIGSQRLKPCAMARDISRDVSRVGQVQGR